MADKMYIQINGKKQEAKGEVLDQLQEIKNEASLIEAEQQAKAEARESAMAKLKKLGLTDDEIAALVP